VRRLTPVRPVRAPLTVVVPAYQCASTLQACLEGLAKSDLPRSEWELIVVDDGSTDETREVAERVADYVIRVADGPLGPAHARNVGAQGARTDLLVFVDADVLVAPWTLRGFAELFAADTGLTAAFGAYDDHPADRGIVSQYRNLLHHYVHTQHAGEALTFWTGCGAVRREAFLAAGGFNAVRYRRPQVEDIDLGYRLRDRGARILLVPTLTGTHLKHWSLAGMLSMDFHDRAVPWMRLLLARHEGLSHGPLNLAPWEKVFTASAGIGIAGLVASLVTESPVGVWVALVLAIASMIGNGPLFAFFAARNGWGFALSTIPLRLAFYAVSALGAAWAVATVAFNGSRVTSLPPLEATLE
jgi:hypothetical protein